MFISQLLYTIIPATPGQSNHFPYTVKKRKKLSLICKEIQKGSVAKSYLIIEEGLPKMRKYLTIYEEAVSHILMTLEPIPSEFPYMRKIFFSFYQ